MMESIEHTMKIIGFNGAFVACSKKKKKKGGRSRWKIKGNAFEQGNLFFNIPEILLHSLQSIHGSDSEYVGLEWNQVVNHEGYKAYLVLRSIDCFINQESVSQGDLWKIDSLVPASFEHRNSCDLSQRMSPKLHYLSHLVEQIQVHCPLIHYSTLRSERKHQTFKQKAKTWSNSISYSLSLVRYNQRITALNARKKDPYQEVGLKKKLTEHDLVSISSQAGPFPYKVTAIIAEEVTIKVGNIYEIKEGFLLIKLIARESDGFFATFGHLYLVRSFVPSLHSYEVTLQPGLWFQYPALCFQDCKPCRMFSFRNKFLINKVRNTDICS